MILYLAGNGFHSSCSEFFRDTLGKRLYLLQSFLDMKGKNFEKGVRDSVPRERFFLDSGAFSAFTQGTKIDIDEYINYIKESEVPLYAVLDVIGDYKATHKNLSYMESKGLSPLPCFHYGSPLEELEKLVEKYDYIALGGLVPLAAQRKSLQSWLDTCFSIIRDRCKIHGFGVNSLWSWIRYPFYSVDATSWLTGGQYRRVIEFKDGKFITHAKNDEKSKTLGRYKTIQKNYVYLNTYNASEYYKAAEYVTKLWDSRGVSWVM